MHQFVSTDYVAVLAENIWGDEIHHRFLNISGLLSPASSSLDSASTWLPQAPADFCGRCIIEAPGGIRLVYWVRIFSENVLQFRSLSRVARRVSDATTSKYLITVFDSSGCYPSVRNIPREKRSPLNPHIAPVLRA